MVRRILAALSLLAILLLFPAVALAQSPTRTLGASLADCNADAFFDWSVAGNSILAEDPVDGCAGGQAFYATFVEVPVVEAESFFQSFIPGWGTVGTTSGVTSQWRFDLDQPVVQDIHAEAKLKVAITQLPTQSNLNFNYYISPRQLTLGITAEWNGTNWHVKIWRNGEVAQEFLSPPPNFHANSSFKKLTVNDGDRLAISANTHAVSDDASGDVEQCDLFANRLETSVTLTEENGAW